MMAVKEIAGVTVQVDDEGYMTDHSQWTKDIALHIANEEGIDELTTKHWQIIEYLQNHFKEHNNLPTIRKLKKSGIVSTKELYQLFPGGPLKKASKISGLLKPASCV